MVRIGCETGTLAAALRQAATVGNLFEPLWIAMHGKIAYLLLVPAYAFMVLVFIMLKIVPSFEKIFRDFGSQLPELTRSLITVSNITVNYWFLLLPFYYDWPSFDVLSANPLFRMDELGLARHGPVHAAIRFGADSRYARVGRWPESPDNRRDFRVGTILSQESDTSATGASGHRQRRGPRLCVTASLRTASFAPRKWRSCEPPSVWATCPGRCTKWPTAAAVGWLVASKR